MPSKVTHLTKIVDVKEVEFTGKLNHSFDEGWYVGEDYIDTWFEKLAGKYVRLTITNIAHDDTPMLKGTTITDIKCELCHGTGFAGCGAGDGLSDGVYCPGCNGSGKEG